jgi:hypothetical protein
MPRPNLASALAILLCAVASPAAAQVHPESSLPIARDCGARLDGAGKAIEHPADEPLSEARRRALSAGIFGALRDPTGARSWPGPQIAAAPACPIARFDAGELTWTISAGAGDAPPRWVRANGQEDVFFLAPGPSPTGAAGQAYYLVGTDGDLRLILKVYDGPPDTRTIADDLAQAITGRAVPIGAYDAEGQAVTLFLPTASGHTAEVFEPEALRGWRSATIFGTDGRFFTRDEADAILFSGSGLACAPAYGPFVRDRLMVLDARDGALDLACRLSTEESWITVFASRSPDPSRDRAVFAAGLRDAESEGVSRRLRDPPVGRDRTIQAGRRWVDRDGAGQGLWYLRRGEYIIELRATFALDDAQAVLDVLAQISASLADPKDSRATRVSVRTPAAR